MLVFDGIVLFAFSSTLITIAIIPVILSGILVLVFAKKFRKLIYIRSVSEAEKYSHFVESINGMSTIKALASEDECNDRAELKIIDSIQKGFTLSNLGNLQSTLQGFLSQAGNLAVYWYGSFLIMQGKLSLGQLISFVTLLGFFLGPLSRLITLQPQLQELSVASKRLGEILDLSEEKSAEGTKLIPKDIKGNDELQKYSDLENDNSFRIAVFDNISDYNDKEMIDNDKTWSFCSYGDLAKALKSGSSLNTYYNYLINDYVRFISLATREYPA